MSTGNGNHQSHTHRVIINAVAFSAYNVQEQQILNKFKVHHTSQRLWTNHDIIAFMRIAPPPPPPPSLLRKIHHEKATLFLTILPLPTVSVSWQPVQWLGLTMGLTTTASRSGKAMLRRGPFYVLLVLVTSPCVVGEIEGTEFSVVPELGLTECYVTRDTRVIDHLHRMCIRNRRNMQCMILHATSRLTGWCRHHSMDLWWWICRPLGVVLKIALLVSSFGLSRLTKIHQQQDMFQLLAQC